MDYIKMTDEFITAMEQPKGVDISEGEQGRVLSMRLCLIREEAEEVEDAVCLLADKVFNAELLGIDMAEEIKAAKAALLKELCDLQYVLSGFAVTFGLPFDEAFKRVHESNMSKLGPDGKPIYRDDGKVLKGPNYKKPDLSDLV